MIFAGHRVCTKACGKASECAAEPSSLLNLAKPVAECDGYDRDGPSTSPPPSSDAPQFPSTCPSRPLVFGRSNVGVDLPPCVKSTDCL